MPINVAQFPDLTKNAKVQWQNARAEFPSVRTELANVYPVGERTSEHNSGISSAETARRRDDGDDAYIGTFKQGYTKNFTQTEIALMTEVTKHLRKFDKYGEIMKRARASGRGVERRAELDIASLLSYAWSTSYTNLDGETVTTAAPDGLALIHSAHTVKGSSSTFSTQIDSNHDEFSADVLERLEEVGNGFLDDGDGRGIPHEFTHIITGRHSPTRHAVKRVLSSELLSANNEKNDFKEYKHIVVPFLDYNAQTQVRDSAKKKYVFLANLTNKDFNGFCMEVSQEAMFDVGDNQITENSVWQWLTTMMYDFGVIRANFIVGTKGDGTVAS